VIALPGIRLARARHLREVEAIARHPACRGFMLQDGKPFSARAWFESGASFYLFDGGWIGAVPRNVDEVYLHVAVLPGYRGPRALRSIKQVQAYLLADDSPLSRAYAIVSRHNRAVRSMAVAVGMHQTQQQGEWIEYLIERSV